MAGSPTQKSLKYLRDLGYSAQVVEHFNYFTKSRKDLFGIIDIVAIKPGISGVLGVQVTSTDNLSAREKKAAEIPEVKIWIECGNPFEFHGWSKKGKVGKRKLWAITKREYGG